MKKIYIKPEIENIEITISCVCNDSPTPELETGGNTPVGEEDITRDAGAARGDWDNIWGN